MIDYGLIQQSIDFYADAGFHRLEVPWTVSPAVLEVTIPPERIRPEFKHNGKCPVGSAEQSFLYLYLKGHLPKGRFQAVTPCFRDESFDWLHSKYFVKNELIVTDHVNENLLDQVINRALEFFSQHLEVKKVKTDEGWDIVSKRGHIELGSYGMRSCEWLDWIFATGCAEPRLSKAIEFAKR